MIVVMDSNLFFSALISPHGPPAKVLNAWAQGRFEVVTCDEQIEEIRQASRYPKFREMFKPHRVGKLLNDLQAGPMMHGFAKRYLTLDPTDDYLLNLAAAAKAHYLITGDRRSGLLSKPKVVTTRICTAAVFCTRILQEK